MKSDEQIEYLRQRLLKRKDEDIILPDLEPYEILLMGFETAITDLENAQEEMSVSLVELEPEEAEAIDGAPVITIIEKDEDASTTS